MCTPNRTVKLSPTEQCTARCCIYGLNPVKEEGSLIYDTDRYYLSKDEARYWIDDEKRIE
jgi:hypothetical protein